MMQGRIVGGLLVAVLGLADTAFAADGSPGGHALELEPVTVTATRHESKDFEVPTAMTIVDAERIRAGAPSVLADALRGEAGVFVQATTPGQAAPVIRGLIGSGTLMLVDGLRLNSAIFRSAPNQYFAFVDPYNVERIEVVRGAGSTLYGSDAMGGVIHVLTPQWRFRDPDWQLKSDALAQFSSADLGSIGHVALAGGRKGLSIAAGMTYQNHDDIRTGDGVKKPTAYSSYAGNSSLLVDDERQELLLAAQYLIQPNTPRYDELVPGFGQTDPSSAVFSFEPNDRLFTHGRYRLRAPVEAIDRVELQAGYQQINDDRRNRDFGGSNQAREDNEHNRSELIGLHLQLMSNYRELVMFTYGVEVYLDRTQSSRYGRDINTQETSERASRFADGATMNSYAAYLQNEIDPLPKLSVVLGGRYSYYDLDLPADAVRPAVHLDYHDVTGNLGLLYRLTDTLHLASNVGRGFRVPNVFDLSTLGPRPGNRFGAPNPDLHPEQVISVDAGTKMLFDRIHGELFGFYSLFNDRIEDVTTGATTEDGRLVVQSQNLSDLTLLGVEASADVLVLEELKLFGTLTYTWGEQRAAGATSPADRIPPLNGRLGARYFVTPALALEGFTRFASDQNRLSDRDRSDPRIDPNGSAGWATANLGLLWDITPQLSGRFLLENVADSTYREHGSGIDAPGINAVVSVAARL